MRTVTCVALSAMLLTSACQEPLTPPDTSVATRAPVPIASANLNSRVVSALQAGGAYAESSYLACIHTYVAQGLPLKEVYLLCQARLDQLNEMGWGPSGAPFAMPSKAPPGFNAGTVTTACGAGNPALGDGGKFGSARYLAILNDPLDAKAPDKGLDFGIATWGGKGETNAEGYSYKGLTEAESRAEKEKAIDDALAKLAEWEKAKAEADANPKDAAKATVAADKRWEYEKAKKKADADPNLLVPVAGDANGTAGVAMGAGTSTCATILQVAREVLAECHRTGWKTTTCQQLHADVKGCPDPTLIYVDPESGYACAPTVDPQLAIDAWQQGCEQNTTPGPDGGSPCNKPVPSESGRTLTPADGDQCTNPYGLVDPEAAGCFPPLVLDGFGRPDVGGLIVWGQGVFGGPIVVLPLAAPPIVIKRV